MVQERAQIIGKLKYASQIRATTPKGVVFFSTKTRLSLKIENKLSLLRRLDQEGCGISPGLAHGPRGYGPRRPLNTRRRPWPCQGTHPLSNLPVMPDFSPSVTQDSFKSIRVFNEIQRPSAGSTGNQLHSHCDDVLLCKSLSVCPILCAWKYKGGVSGRQA